MYIPNVFAFMGGFIEPQGDEGVPSIDGVWAGKVGGWGGRARQARFCFTPHRTKVRGAGNKHSQEAGSRQCFVYIHSAHLKF